MPPRCTALQTVLVCASHTHTLFAPAAMHYTCHSLTQLLCFMQLQLRQCFCTSVAAGCVAITAAITAAAALEAAAACCQRAGPRCSGGRVGAGGRWAQHGCRPRLVRLTQHLLVHPQKCLHNAKVTGTHMVATHRVTPPTRMRTQSSTKHWHTTHSA